MLMVESMAVLTAHFANFMLFSPVMSIPVAPGFSWGWIILFASQHPSELPNGISTSITAHLLRRKRLVKLLKLSSKR
jgi:hypothetical protein